MSSLLQQNGTTKTKGTLHECYVIIIATQNMFLIWKKTGTELDNFFGTLFYVMRPDWINIGILVSHKT